MKLIGLSDPNRFLGTLLVAARGTGKTRLLGRHLLPADCYREIATIVIDPTGELIQNFLSKVCELPREDQEVMWPRIRYIDMAGRNGTVVPFPLLYPGESLFQIARRWLDVVRLSDHLHIAPITGMNPLYHIGTYAGMVLYACGCQISEIENLLQFPETWESRFVEAEKKYPEVKRATDFFRSFKTWGKDRRLNQTMSLLIKASTFTVDPTSRAMFCAALPSLDPAVVIGTGQTVLIDFSGLTDIERRRYAFMWVLFYIMEFIKKRGPGQHPPLSLVIDEFSVLTNFQASEDNSFTQALDELINVYSRSHRLWLTIATQTIGTFEEGMQRSLLSLDNHIYGRIADMDSALKIAKWIATFDPKMIKHMQPVYASVEDPQGAMLLSRGRVHIPKKTIAIDVHPEFYPLLEQEYLAAKMLRDLPKFNFLVRPAEAHEFIRMSIENLDSKYVNMKNVEFVREVLRKRSGLPVQTILEEIEKRIPKALPESAIVKHEEKRRSVPPKPRDTSTDADL